ncbi:WecB/TagA/CpsF family glycosyltransferase [Hespellia stercorisuis]|uniref:Polymer biosynthesis protein, WecB/TagA/CpsF family n=1 Tax=Hespellia stercorisuis DSM 15480 TaxID=1121950 RepID=A0A1M6TE20_9FIRM|nr:WecB/TagA/CpsF family glycosyltransferase [Hespellia stercorisuis]SHK55282.1 polymer biosynthesis protein, WecB/TagA/CpsF family [Hespellia stercorisuis DSM 15480]
MARIRLLNTYIDNLTMQEAIHSIDKLIQKKEKSYVVTPNLDHIVLIEKDCLFKEIYEMASLILTDGQPLIWISKIKHTPIVQKVSGSDLFPKVCEMASMKGYSLFILGAAKGVAEKAADNLCMKYEGLKVVGTYSPKIGFEKDKKEMNHIYQMIHDVKPDILAVSLGSPKGEKFIYQNLEELDVPLSMSIGAAVDFEAGKVNRAPNWMSKCGLEWLYRTFKEPKRLAKRYWNDAKSIIPILIKYK